MNDNGELRRILAVEDEEDIVRILDMSLRQVGKYELQLCRSGKDALAVAADFRPDLMLLDFMMPGMDGLSLMHELRRIPEVEDVPVVFLTAKSQPNEVQGYLDAGAVAVINKPFDPIQLPHEVSDIWKKLPR